VLLVGIGVFDLVGAAAAAAAILFGRLCGNLFLYFASTARAARGPS